MLKPIAAQIALHFFRQVCVFVAIVSLVRNGTLEESSAHITNARVAILVHATDVYHKS